MKTIKTDTHLLLVDETADLFEGDKASSLDGLMITISKGWNNSLKLNMHKIIAASPKLGDLPEFETLSPNTEDDVEKVLIDLCKNKGDENNTIDLNAYGIGVIDGYNQAKSETGFSLDNMKKSMFEVYKNGLREPKDGKENFNEIYNRVIRTLTKPKEYEFVPEEVFDYKDKTSNSGYGYGFGKQIKVVNNRIQGFWKEIN